MSTQPVDTGGVEGGGCTCGPKECCSNCAFDLPPEVPEGMRVAVRPADGSPPRIVPSELRSVTNSEAPASANLAAEAGKPSEPTTKKPTDSMGGEKDEDYASPDGSDASEVETVDPVARVAERRVLAAVSKNLQEICDLAFEERDAALFSFADSVHANLDANIGLPQAEPEANSVTTNPLSPDYDGGECKCEDGQIKTVRNGVPYWSPCLKCRREQGGEQQAEPATSSVTPREPKATSKWCSTADCANTWIVCLEVEDGEWGWYCQDCAESIVRPDVPQPEKREGPATVREIGTDGPWRFVVDFADGTHSMPKATREEAQNLADLRNANQLQHSDGPWRVLNFAGEDGIGVYEFQVWRGAEAWGAFATKGEAERNIERLKALAAQPEGDERLRSAAEKAVTRWREHSEARTFAIQNKGAGCATEHDRFVRAMRDLAAALGSGEGGKA